MLLLKVHKQYPQFPFHMYIAMMVKDTLVSLVHRETNDCYIRNLGVHKHIKIVEPILEVKLLLFAAFPIVVANIIFLSSFDDFLRLQLVR